MRYLPDESTLPYGPETVTVNCDECGESTQTHEEHARIARESADADLLCDTCQAANDKQRLISALLTGDDDVYSRGMAASYLNSDFADVFPIRDEENDRWVLSVERDFLDGRSFVGSWVEITEGNDPCPDCGDTRRHFSTFDNGVIGGHRESCTICKRIYSEDAG